MVLALYLSPKGDELWIILIIELIQHSDVFAVAHQPVNRGKMFPLSKLLVQCPEHLTQQ